MTEADDSDLLAAEYVLGTLDVADRRLAASRIDTDIDFARAVEQWQYRLAPLTETVTPVLPPDHILGELLDRLFGATVVDLGAVSRLRRRVRLWQVATAGSAALAASLLGWITLGDRLDHPDRDRFTAVLQRDAGAPAMLLNVDLRTRRLTVTPLSATTPAGKSYELWIIDTALAAPRSLGIVPSRSSRQETLAQLESAVITDATYAVTLEPAGGSPTGQPSGTPLFSGRLISTAP